MGRDNIDTGFMQVTVTCKVCMFVCEGGGGGVGEGSFQNWL